MNSLMTQLGIDRLSIEDQVRLVGEVLANLDVAEPPLTDAQRAELDSRIAAIDNGTMPFKTWSEVESRILKKLGD